MKIFLLWGILVCMVALIGCQPATIETSSPAAAIDIPTVRGTAAPTETPPPTATQTANIATFTPQLTNTPRPSRTPFPTQTPNPSPWLIDRSTPFFFFETLDEILIGYPDGQFQAVTEGEIMIGQPWSPDGTKFIFWTGRWPNTVNVFIANLQTGEVQPLDFIQRTKVFWSPDGRYLLYPKDGDNNDIQVMIYNVETGHQTVLGIIPREYQVDYYNITGWSPDSRKVAYVSEIEGQYDLFVVDVETLLIQQITDDPEIEVHVAWSPGENQLLVATTLDSNPFVHPPYSAQELYLMDEHGTGRQHLAEFDNLLHISWSPDGRQIAFSDYGLLCILTVDDLSKACPLEDIFPADEFNAAFNDPPTWSPDRQWLAFQARRSGPPACIQSYLLNISTNELVRLEEENCFQTQFHWSPAVP